MKPGKDFIGVGVGVILVKDNKILLILRKKGNEWSIPGGKVELGERMEDAAVREIKEELRLGIKIKREVYTAQTFTENNHWISVSFLGEIISGEPKAMAPDEFEEIKWFDLNNLPEKQFLPSKLAIEEFMKKKEKIIPIVGGVVVNDGKILFIERIKEPYKDYWSIPGGKLDFGESVKECAVREFKEETNIDTEFERIGGVAHEIIEENGKELGHYDIYVCKLKPLHLNHKEMYEGKLRWIAINDLEKEKIIPSDVLMIKEFILKDNKANVWNVKMIKKGDKYSVEEFKR